MYDPNVRRVESACPCGRRGERGGKESGPGRGSGGVDGRGAVAGRMCAVRRAGPASTGKKHPVENDDRAKERTRVAFRGGLCDTFLFVPAAQRRQGGAKRR